MALNANALITLEKAKDHLDILPTDASQDDRVEDLINTGSNHIEEYTGRLLKKRTGEISYYDGKGDVRLLLEQFPVIQITEIGVDWFRNWTYSTILAPGSYALDKEIVLVKRDGIFPEHVRSVKVTYDFGYDPVPDDLQRACLLFVEFYFRARSDRRIGVDSKSKSGETINYSETLPDPIQRLINPYVRETYLKNKGII